jgi:CcmD family protein
MAVPLHEAVKYVAAAYVVVFVLVALYVAIMGRRLARVERELSRLDQR